ncbi:MAG: endonuclease/exonuclease/phosphatase family metal-dependent hydrolase [Lysobacterales bacterium]|jgi:endonuclease/exonuclease/phosphatase family metal-dependent hydrolase
MPRYIAEDIVSNFTSSKDTLKVVSYNIKYAKKTKKAIKILSTYSDINDADIILLQEMDLDGVKRIAQALHYNFVYYPAVLHPINAKDFGNAVLSKWPILDDYKVILPHQNINKRQRIAVVTTLDVNNTKVAAISLHLGIFNKPTERKQRIDKILSTIPEEVTHAIVGGDFNTFTKKDNAEILASFTRNNYILATRDIGWTNHAWYLLRKKPTLDHIYTSNMEVINKGKVKDKSASDHIPIWAELKLK